MVLQIWKGLGLGLGALFSCENSQLAGQSSCDVIHYSGYIPSLRFDRSKNDTTTEPQKLVCYKEPSDAMSCFE